MRVIVAPRGILEADKPVTPDGRVRVKPEKLVARHEAQVLRAIQEDGVALIVLGRSHDLSESIRRLGVGTTEYATITTEAYRAVAGGRWPGWEMNDVDGCFAGLHRAG